MSYTLGISKQAEQVQRQQQQQSRRIQLHLAGQVRAMGLANKPGSPPNTSTA